MIEWRQQCSNLKWNHKTQPSSFTAVLNIFDVIFMINKVIAMENFDQFDFYMKFTFTFMPSECAKFVCKIERALHDRRLLRCLFWFARKEMDGNWLCCPESFLYGTLDFNFCAICFGFGKYFYVVVCLSTLRTYNRIRNSKEFPPLYLLSRQVLLQNFFKYADLWITY